ncbi:MAG: TIGR00153 family protein [Nitrospirae bacterium CG18_big_fil_WC_8_21_14_2_50_70_55]|nr:TIGR00153 family protein [Deltaproteobacteria bacterium]OIP66230.1 MAG: TIGR00153 family protein [Nitrospirae bacterium CG2_30_70_394]PIQ03156.1 MAG: TIGR00153 family protein [Nitrospirae bacterium CG18_big_fil_WC_8_21_14_2_50_70_55]PIU78314.1 MAG: TIGR00153 family protein [Nitrospirae bacterium CG06_land_8_20_14_3_00_70_43]PIW82319.1 MAG: TIGR00153 family protein [Nitrospirae bacterium CG_4_8_14_3_um_filter_70_85]PIX83757.1 MAG: TIGR00153 family protein [Nitrospirae bacterium CG_4_10_14_3_
MPTSLLGDLFGRSPFQPMQRHMELVRSCVAHVVPLFAAVAAGDGATVAAERAQIDDLEHQADMIKNALRAHLPKGFFLPVARRDLLEILDFQDNIADTAQDLAELVAERRMVLPAPMAEPMLALVKSGQQACDAAAAVIAELDELLEMGFRGREASRVETMVDKLADQEEESDRLEMEVNRILFALEGELDPVTVIFWYRMIELAGDLADYSKKVGSRLRLFLAT